MPEILSARPFAEDAPLLFRASLFRRDARSETSVCSGIIYCFGTYNIKHTRRVSPLSLFQRVAAQVSFWFYLLLLLSANVLVPCCTVFFLGYLIGDHSYCPTDTPLLQQHERGPRGEGSGPGNLKKTTVPIIAEHEHVSLLGCDVHCSSSCFCCADTHRPHACHVLLHRTSLSKIYTVPVYI